MCAVLDALQLVPDPLLKRRSHRCDGHLERAAPAGEVLLELDAHVREARVVAQRARRRLESLRGHVEPGQRTVHGCQQQLAEGARDCRVRLAHAASPLSRAFHRCSTV